VQLHPRDCRAAFIEFNHTEGSDDVEGPYPPAGPAWRNFIRKDVTQALTAVEMQSPDPQNLAEHWSSIIGVPVSIRQNGMPELMLPNASFRFIRGDDEIMSGLDFRVADVAKVCEAARTKGYVVSGNEFLIGGLTFRLTR